MLECWNEHPIDRPTFTKLRSKFSDMLLATTSDTYMILEVDDQKVYYTVADDDEKRERSDSSSSSDSDSSIKKSKSKEIKKPVWSKPVNPYVDTPASRLEPITEYAQDDDNVVTVEQHDTSSSDEDEYDRRGIESAYVDQPAMRSVPNMSDSNSNEPQNGHVLSSEDGDRHMSTGVPISLLTDNKPTQHTPVTHHSKSNPYVDSPGTGQLLPDPPKYENEIVIDSSRMKPLSEELGLMDGGDTGTVL